MKVVVDGKEIDLGEPEEGEKTLDYLTLPEEKNEISLEDTIEISSEELDEIIKKESENK